MMNKNLLNKINEAETISEDKLYTKSIVVKDYNILKVRDYLIIDGSIVDEDLKNNIYTAYYRTGFLNMSRSIVGIILEKDKLTIAGSSKKIVDTIASDLSVKKNSKNKKGSKKYFIISILLLVILALLFSVFAVNLAIRVTSSYNEAVNKFNNVAIEYNKDVVKLSVENIEGVPGEVELLLEVDDGFFPVALSVIKGNSASKIQKDIQTIDSMITTLNEGKKIIKNIYNPSSQEVEERLKNINEIDQIKSVTKYNDPNELLGKEHGYNECVYFTIDGLKIDGITSTDPIVLGTNGGGCIEVYSTVEDALERCEYLRQFDNTLLYTGSYAVVGTMVVRTSYVLTEEQQYTLTNYIVEQFTKN